MSKTLFNLKRLKAVKQTVVFVFLLFSLIMVPLAPVFAQQADSTPSPEVSTPDSTPTAPETGTPTDSETPSNSPQTVDTPSDETPAPEEANPDDKIVDEPKTEEDETKDDTKEEEPEAARGQAVVDPLKPFESQSESNSRSIVPSPDPTTGALVSDYPITVPPGRNGVQPDLKLRYSSQDKEQNSIFGLGWSANIPSISRVNKKGSNTLFTDNYFTSSLSGDLVNTTGSSYSSKVEDGSFLKYTFSSNTWTVVDKNGTTYTFGSSAATRQDNPSDSTQISKWMLEKMEDTNGNFISYTYYKDAGQIYPDTITYTSNGATTGIFTVVFTHSSRTDTVSDSSPGFKTVTNYRISQIQANISGTWVRTYALAYTADSPSTVSLLSSITESGQEGGVTTTLPAQTFTYQDVNPASWSTYDTSWSTPTDKFEVDFAAANGTTALTIGGVAAKISFSDADGSRRAVMVDVNGDGLTDAVQSFRSPGGTLSGNNFTQGLDNTYVYLNTGSGWVYSSSWTTPTDQWQLAAEASGSYPTRTYQGHSAKISFGTGASNDGSSFAVLADVNGDGLPDAVQSHRDASAGLNNTYVYINNGSGWTYDSSWNAPTDQFQIDYASINGMSTPMIGGVATKISFASNDNDGSHHAMLVDVNGDGLVDAVQSYRIMYGSGTDKTYVYINNGNGWTYDSTWSTPRDEWQVDAQANGYPTMTLGGVQVKISFGTSNDGMSDAVMADVNGDGLPDAVQSYRSVYYSMNKTYVYINNGHGWVYDSTWSASPTDQFEIDFQAANGNPPPTIGGVGTKISFSVSGADSSKHAILVDVNGDGLNDAVQSYRYLWGGGGTDKVYVYINTGTGWVYDSNWSTPTDRWQVDATTNGAPSITLGGTVVKVSFATQGDGAKDNVMADINGDGMPDGIQSFRDTYYAMNKTYVYKSAGTHPLLSSITMPEGGSYSFTYKPTPQYVDGSNNLLNPNTPYIVQTLSGITKNDGLGNTGTTSYSYAGGRYYYDSADKTTRKFAGFATITKTDPAGNTTKAFYHQGNTSDTTHGEYSDEYWKIGKLYRTEIADSSGNIYSKTINKWDSYSPSTGIKFVKLAQTLEITYDGDSDHKEKAVSYTYDNTYGNLTEQVEYGEVTGADDGTFTDTGSDKFTTDYSYAVNTTPYIVGRPSQDTTVDQSSVKVSENKYYYDGQTLGNVTDGNMTKQEMWKTGSTYINTQKAYNTTYGIVTSATNARGKSTSYSYDTYNLYPATVTNALSQATSYTYDYSSGQVTQVTDPNSRVFQKVYDGLDRLKEEKQPDLSTPATLVTKTSYTYTDTSGAVKVKQTDSLDGSTDVDTYTYFDGLNRPIQTRKEMESSNTFAVIDSVYNNFGQIYKESLPYSSTGSSKTSATTTSALLTTYTYDPMMRVTSTVSAVGTISNAYDDWKLTVTDPRSKTKDLYNDAYGNLIRVDEHNSGSTYSTYYEYNGNNKLTKITDALSNIRNFTYDGLSRRLTAQDLHASGDSTYGSWTYTYDDDGNVTSIVDPKSQTINYTYDDLDRKSTEDYTGVAGTEVTYSYDSGTDGIGRLTSVAATGANTSYTYNPVGGLKQEVETISSTGYTTSYTYDRQGNQLEITNPDSSKVKYTYNTAGQLETVQRKESTDGSFINVVTNFDYGPHGKITSETFQNGASTTNTYDSAKLYRLSNKTTTITGGSKMQDLTYTYDNNSNVTRIVDASNTNSSKTVDYTYDDLNRLLSATATSVASGQSTYTHSYTYDAIGNILTRTDAAGTYSYAGNTGTDYANPHAVTSVGSVAYTYDNNGNMLTETSGLSNTWDYNNRLTQAIKGGVTSTYTYDYAGQRVKSANGTITTIYPSQYYNTDGTTPVKHITTPDGETVATVKGTGVGAAVFSVHTDHLTGSNVVTNSGGTQEELLDYFPYGNTRIDQKSGTFDEQRKFTGHEYDADTGLNYMGSRYYKSDTGRFISQDPVFLQAGFDLSDPQGLNSYAYARNNPLRYVDPNGQWFMDLVMGRQSWSDFSVEVGDAANYMYNNSSTWKAAMDHPIAAGAAVGVAGGLAAAGAVAAAPTVAAVASRAATTVANNPDVAIRAGTGAALNVANTALQAQVEKRPVSGWEYAYSAGSGALTGGINTKSAIASGAVAAASTASQQYFFNFDKGFDLTSITSSGVTNAAVSKLFGIPGITSAPQVYKFMTEQVVVFTADTPIQVINSGVKESRDEKRGK